MVEFLRGQWKDLKEMVDGYSIMLMEGLLIVPVIMAALFYPVEVLVGVGVVLLVALVVFEAIEWVRYHPHRHAESHPHPPRWRFPL
jgi:hypothetical protein